MNLMNPKKKRIKHQLKRLPRRLALVRGEGRSQRQFAADLGHYQQNINRYERGACPGLVFVIDLAQQEGVSLNWLLLGEGPVRRPNRTQRR